MERDGFEFQNPGSILACMIGRLGLAAVLALVSFTCASTESDGRMALTIELVDRGRVVPGLIRIRDSKGAAVPVPALLSRGLGLAPNHASHAWQVLPGRRTLRLPREPLTVEAFHGLETELARVAVDGAAGEDRFLRIPLRRFSEAAASGWRGVNTHLHLKDIGREEADRYLREVPAADGLDGLFVSYLERKDADRTYISNGYTEQELVDLGGDAGVWFGNGEEHRHNFGGFDEGYGHVMFLDLRKLIRPVSIGRGIMKAGTDAPPLQQGIDEARKQGATVLWCHNTFGLEDLPNWIEGRPQAQNIFDGDPEAHGSYRDTFYRYLNAGLRVPFSTGTDWFIYDFSRAYALVPEPAGPRDWLKALEAGRTFITNGPLLEFETEGKGPGETVSLAGEGRVAIKGRARGRVDFGRLQLVRNGEVVATEATRPAAGHFEAAIETTLPVDGPCWLALRVPPLALDPTGGFIRSEVGGPIFAHTSAVHVEVAGRKVFIEEVARGLLEEMKQARKQILEKGVFAGDHERDHVLAVYARAISSLEKRLQR
jgi:hypothetical protein